MYFSTSLSITCFPTNSLFCFSSHSYIGVIVDMRKKKKKRFILESYAIFCVDLLSKYKYERFVKVTLAFSASHLSYFT